MAAKIDQKAYLQKYLTGSSGDKKKKKKKVVKGKGIKFIDDDIDLSKLRPFDVDELDILDQGEDAPQIAGIIDERPEEIRKMEQFNISSKWKVVNQDDGFNSKLQVHEIKKAVKEKEKENELIFGKMYSDSEDEAQKPDRDNCNVNNKEKSTRRQNSDNDVSPPRKNRQSPKRQNDNDSDQSPPRKGKSNDKKNKGYDSDQSPPRKNQREGRSKRGDDSEQSPPRKNSRKEQKSSKRNQDSDESPLRKISQKEHRSKRSYDSDQSPPRRHNESKDKRSKGNDSDQSPPRKLEGRRPKERRKPSRWGEWGSEIQSSDASPPRKTRKNSRSPRRNSQSPPRKSKLRTPPKKSRNSPERKRNSDSPIRQKNKGDGKRRKSPRRSDSDASPPRKRSPKNKNDNNKRRNKSPDSDLSPPRRNSERNRRNSDSDLSPPRREDRNKNDSPPPTHKKMAKTLDGKLAGLQDAGQMRRENEAFRRREEEAFNRMNDEVSGRNAKAVSRKSKRDTSEDRQNQKEKAEKQKELDDKYKKWSRGLKQIQDQESRVQEFMHEAAKPLARHKDDADLEGRLKQIEREGDPMLRYIKEKKRERGELGPERPSYKGSFPPNRFNIRPGYRWDGVDRSNGYEKSFFDHQSKRKAQEEEAYKWSTEDL